LRPPTSTTSTTTADALRQVASDPDTIERHFPAAARTAAREGLDGDAARQALLLALPGDAAYVVELVSRVYEHGDPAERPRCSRPPCPHRRCCAPARARCTAHQ
jgi:hypothetical protein